MTGHWERIFKGTMCKRIHNLRKHSGNTCSSWYFWGFLCIWPTTNWEISFKQFVADGVFKAELNEFLTRELAEDGYSGVEVRVTPIRTEIIILATRTQNVLGEKGRRIRELTSVVQKRFGFPEGTVEVIQVVVTMLCKIGVLISGSCTNAHTEIICKA